MFSRVHILVLNHNGRPLLEECLPSVVACARSSSRPCRVTVVDNESTDDSAEFVRDTCPDVRWIRLPNDVLVSFNEAMRRVAEPVVLLLNNDVKLVAGCVDRLADAFDRYPDCFLASPLCWTFDGRYEGTRCELRFRRGLVSTKLAPKSQREAAVVHGDSTRVLRECGLDREPESSKTPCHGFTASSGAVMAVNRKRFLELGGFDAIFLPGRFEDLDLAFRGWLAGWNAYYVPEAVAYHKGSASFATRLKRTEGTELDVRNSLLFAWKNLREPWHLTLHVTFLAARLARALATGQGTFLRGWASALRMLPDVMKRRQGVTKRLRSERELFEMLCVEQLNR